MSARESTWPFRSATVDQQARELLLLEREIAEEAARVDIECHALQVPSNHPLPVYDVSEVGTEHVADESMRDAHRRNIARAVRYLDMRQLLVRPIKDSPQLVAFKNGGV